MYHLIGIKGEGMSALAQILFDLGYEVQGSDVKDYIYTEDNLIKKGIKILEFNEKNIKDNLIIIKGNAFDEENIEVKEALKLELNIHTYPEMLGKLSKMFQTITIAGCHGKTTTTSMLSQVLNELAGVNYLIGDGTGHANKENKFLILESCEYKRDFLEYKSDYAIITNIEYDHSNYFENLDDVLDAYREYAKNAEKMVIACGDDQYTRFLNIEKPIFFYGTEEDNDIIAKNIEYTENGTTFEVFVEENYYGKFDIPIYGKHMLLNALAVISICYYERLDVKDVANSLKQYENKRNFKQTIIDDTVLINDHAHHPTEIKATIKGIKQKYPTKKIVLVIELNSKYSDFKEEYIEELGKADITYIISNEEKLKNCKNITKEDANIIAKNKGAVIAFLSPNNILNLENKVQKILEGE